VRKADNLPPSCADVTKSGGLNFLEPSRPVQDCNGTAFPFYICTGSKNNKCDPSRLNGIIFRKLSAQASLLYTYSSYLSFILGFLNGEIFSIVNSRMINTNAEKLSKLSFKIWAICQSFQKAEKG